MFCSSCGKQINDGAKFCEHCGAAQKPATAVCSNCGKQINYGARFCEHCGATQDIVPVVVQTENVTKSKFSQQEQTNIVGLAVSLETSIEFEKNEIKRIASEGFRDQPKEVKKIAEWNMELDSWMKAKQAKITFVQNDLKENIEALDVLYTTTKIIPNTYRTTSKLLWLYDDMSSSEHDIERSIDMLNHKETSDLLRNMNKSVNEVKSVLTLGFNAVYTAIQENNALQNEIISNQIEQQQILQGIMSNQNVMVYQQAEMITDLEKIRKSARTGNFLNIGSLIQNHNRNKMISDFHDKYIDKGKK